MNTLSGAFVNAGERLKGERIRLGYSVRKFAEAAGVVLSTQQRYESGERTPDATYLNRISGLGAEIFWIIRGTKSTIKPAENLSTLGKRLRYKRKLLCYSLDDFAELGGVSKSAQNTYERDERTPNANYLRALMEKDSRINVLWIMLGDADNQVPELKKFSENEKDGIGDADTIGGARP